jgi:hypothetical protein
MKILNDITFDQFAEIQKNGYSLDIIYLLTLVEKNVDIKSFCKDSVKLKAIYQSIYRKGLITDNGKPTLIGVELLKYINSDIPVEKIVKKIDTADDFDKWWKSYPGTDTFTYKNQTFTGTRSMRVKKDDCKAKLHSILSEGEYTIKEMIGALEYEVVQKKENSVKTKSNRLTFMQNSLTYLNQRTFEAFIELIKEGHKQEIDITIPGSTDI